MTDGAEDPRELGALISTQGVLLVELRETLAFGLRELDDRIALLREALTLALGVIDGTSQRPVHDIIIARATLYETAPPREEQV